MHAERAPLTTAHLQAIFDLAPIGIANVGRDGRFLRANPALVRFLGYPLQTLQTLTFATLTHPDDRAVSDAAFAGLIDGTQDEFVIEKRYRCADGRYAWVRVTGAAVRDERGAFAYFVSLVEDIADRKATEAALRASEERFRALFEQAPYGVILVDATGRPLMANHTYRAIFALADDAPLPRELAAEQRLAASGIVPLLGRALVGEAVSVPPQRYDTPAVSGERARSLWLAVRLHPLRDSDGVVREVALLFEDVTEQYQTAEALRATNESLEQRVAERTRELTALLDITREVASTLDLEPLLGLILDRLVGLVDATMLAVTVLDGEELVQVEYRGPGSREYSVGRRFPINRGSALWRAFQEGRPVTIDDVLTDTELAADLLRSFARSQPTGPTVIRSWLGVPLISKGEAIGMLVLTHLSPHHFTDNDARLVAAFAAQATVAIENAGLYRDVQERLAQVEGLSAVGAALVEERSLERVLRTVGERVIALLSADGCAIALLDPDEGARVPGRELSLAVVIGEQEGDLQGLQIPLHGSFLGEAIISGGPIISGDTGADPRGYPPAMRRPHNSMLALPLRTSERVVGALNVFGRPGKPFGDRDIAIMTLFVQQAAVAIENARLYEGAQALAVLEERQRLARELHDSVSQALYGIALGARTARALVDRDPASVVGPIDYVLSLAEAGLTEMRALIFELRPESLATEGLGAALGKMADAIRVRHRLAVSLDLAAEPDAPLPTKEALYRIAQEATNNAIKHARATQLLIQLDRDQAGYRLVVRDNGIGFDPHGEFEGHFGLTSMRERAGRLGGQLSVTSALGVGSEVTVSLPMAR
jgi:PAS domain S-box-containing protein